MRSWAVLLPFHTATNAGPILYSAVQAVQDENVILNLNLMHLYEHDRALYCQLVAYPGEVIPLFDIEAGGIAEDLGHDLPENKLLTVTCTCSPVDCLMPL